MRINRHEIYVINPQTNKESLIVIHEHPEGKIYIECEKIFPVVVLRNVGIPGVIGPDLEIDTSIESVKQCEEERKASNRRLTVSLP